MPLSSIWEGTGTDPGEGNRKAVPHTPIKSNLINWILDQIVNHDLPYLQQYSEMSITTVTSDYNITSEFNEIVLANTSTSNITITLPDPTTREGRLYTVKKIAAANTVTIQPFGTETIDGDSSKTLTTIYDMFIFTSDGTNWYTVNKPFEHKKFTYDALGINADQVDGVDLPGTIASILTDHNKANHDILNIDADTVDGIDLPNTTAAVLTDHNKALHDALNIDADTVDGMHVSGIPYLSLGVSGNKPTAGTAGRIFFETDTRKIYYDDGSAWKTIGTVNWADILDKPSTYSPSPHAASHGNSGSDAISIDASQITSGTLNANRIPNLDASKITSGRLTLSRLPTNANANVFLVVRTNNADPVWDTLTADDVPTLTRSKISDFFGSPFWGSIPDKPFSTLGSEFVVNAGELQIQSISSGKVVFNTDLIPPGDATHNLGNANNRWASAYIADLFTGDVHMENDWVITEGNKVGIDDPIALVSPDGEVYVFELKKVKEV